MGDDRPIVYQEGKISVYRASSIGSCLTALVAAKAGHTEARSEYAETILMNAAKEGNLHEDSIIDTLKEEHGWRVWGGQDEVEFQIIPRVIIRGHIDGICLPKGARKERLLEVKTMSRDRFKKWMGLGETPRERLLSDEFRKYGWQISAYMHSFGMSAMYVVKNRDSGKLDIGEVKTPPVTVKEIRKHVIEAERWGLNGDIPDCPASGGEKFFCPFPYLHNGGEFGAEPDDEQDPIEDAQLALISGMAEVYHDLARQVSLMKPYDSERKDLGQKIIEAMGGKKGRDYVVAGKFKVKRTDSHNNYTDQKKVAKKLGISVEEYKEILKESQSERPYSYVKVTKIGDK